MGKLTGDERYVVTVEVPGPKTAADAEKINALIDDLKARFGASVKVSVTGFKAAGR
jgi:hypothetical protein